MKSPWCSRWLCCQVCGTSDPVTDPHKSRGLCHRCYDKERYREKKAGCRLSPQKKEAQHEAR